MVQEMGNQACDEGPVCKFALKFARKPLDIWWANPI